jgi:hypothetical protein
MNSKFYWYANSIITFLIFNIIIISEGSHLQDKTWSANLILNEIKKENFLIYISNKTSIKYLFCTEIP